MQRHKSSRFGMTPVGLGELDTPFGKTKGAQCFARSEWGRKHLESSSCLHPLARSEICREVALTWIAFRCLLAHTVGELCPVILPNLQGGMTYALVTTIIWVQSSHANPAASISSLAGRGLPSYHCLRGPCRAQLRQVTNQLPGLAPGRQIKEGCAFFLSLSSCLIPPLG